MNVTEKMIAAAWNVWREEGDIPYFARVDDHVEKGSTGEERARQIASLHAADLEAEAANDALMRRVLEAALDASDWCTCRPGPLFPGDDLPHLPPGTLIANGCPIHDESWTP